MTTMENRSGSTFTWTLGAIFVILSSLATRNAVNGLQRSTRPQHDRVVVCYVAGWAIYRPERARFGLDDLNPEHCTHIVYAFAGLNASSSTIRSLDPYADLEENYGKGTYKKITRLRNRYPGLKVTLAIGGWNEGSQNFSELAASAERRRTFVSDVVNFIRKYDFDGLDLDWEFPAKRGGAPRDKQNFVYLARDLNDAFRSKGLLLTAAIGAGIDTIDAAYDIPELSKYLDYIHVMAYDYHGPWNRKVLSNAPLNSAPDQLTVEDSLRYLLKLGAPANKLVLGLPFYGRTFFLTGPLASSTTSPMRSDTREVGFQGPFTKQDGFMGYNEICKELLNKSSWRKGWDDASATAWAVSGDKVITYDDPRSIMMKADFANKLKLAGVMIWSIDTDDFKGDCADVHDGFLDPLLGVDYPLMRSINLALSRNSPGTDHSDNHITLADVPPKSAADFLVIYRLTFIGALILALL